MKISILNLFAILNMGIVLSQSGLQHPESIIKYKDNYFVSNIGKQLDAALDGDGFISLVNANGIVVTHNFFKEKGVVLNAPKGMAIVDHILYVTDIQRIVGYDLQGNNPPLIIDLSEKSSFLNDIEPLDETSVLVTDTFENNVFRVDLITEKITQTYSGLNGANGITKKDNDIFIVTTGENLDGTGKVFRMNTEGKTEVLAFNAGGILDGVSQVSKNELLISDWKDLSGGQGYMYLYDLEKKTLRKSDLRIISPADFFYDEKFEKVFVPQTLKNKVSVYGIQDLFPDYEKSNLFHFGLIDSFLGGLYDGGYTYKSLLENGDFGLGAPDKLNGEITVLDGKAYQTKVSGKTIIARDTEKTSYAFVTNFNKDFEFSLEKINSKEKLEEKIDEQLLNNNGMYAIKIRGTFKKLKTRAFPPVEKKPYPELTSMLENQAFFEYENISGTLVGFKLPRFLEGINVPGYHFHFISNDESKGGHLLAVKIQNVLIEVDEINSYSVDLPNSDDFKKFDFRKDRSEDVKSAETGKRND